jgi:phosphatidylglycerophosphatase A
MPVVKHERSQTGGLSISAHKQNPHKIRPRQLKHPVVLIALGFGSGLAPIAPGTAGTLVAIPFYLAMQSLPLTVYAAVTLTCALIGIGICGYAAKRLGVHDHPAIVFDEIVGFFITMFAAPPGLLMLLAGFVLFRLFDALKPWPISWIDRNVHGGFGIMFDDVIAGVMSLAVLQLAYHLMVESCDVLPFYCH